MHERNRFWHTSTTHIKYCWHCYTAKTNQVSTGVFSIPEGLASLLGVAWVMRRLGWTLTTKSVSTRGKCNWGITCVAYFSEDPVRKYFCKAEGQKGQLHWSCYLQIPKLLCYPSIPPSALNSLAKQALEWGIFWNWQRWLYPPGNRALSVTDSCSHKARHQPIKLI